MTPAGGDEIEDLERRRFAAMVAGDAESLDRLLSDDLHYCHSNGRLDTKATFLANVRGGPITYHQVERSDTRIRRFDSTAVVTGRARIEVDVTGEPRELDLRYLAIWVCVDDQWRFEAWQSTPVQ